MSQFNHVHDATFPKVQALPAVIVISILFPNRRSLHMVVGKKKVYSDASRI